MPAGVPDAFRVVRSALEVARLHAARKLSFGETGVVLTDPLGAEIALARGGEVFSPDLAAVEEALRHPVVGYGRRSFGDDFEFHGRGTWVVDREYGGIVARPKRPAPGWMGPVMDDPESGMDLLRRLYGRGGFDVFFFVEGESRLEAAAISMSSELLLEGCSPKLDLKPRGRLAMWYDSVSPEGAAVEEGESVFDLPAGGTEWLVREISSSEAVSLIRDSSPCGGSNVFFCGSRGVSFGSRARLAECIEVRERPCVVGVVSLVDSRPRARFLFQRSLGFEAEGLPDPDGGVAELRARWERRSSSRPRAARTWHTTTTSVARAFVKRQAPKGMLSSRSLYFAGPVACSMHDGNPIAAIVDFEGGRQAIFFGRARGYGGTKAAIVTSAQMDVEKAASGRFEFFYVGELDNFILLGGERPSEAVARVRRGKAEAQMPSSCSLDYARLAAWLTERAGACVERLEEAERTSHPTIGKANAIWSCAALERTARRLEEISGVELPRFFDADALEARASRERASAAEWVREAGEGRARLEDRRREPGEPPAGGGGLALR